MKKIYYSWEQVQGACLDIARQLQQDKWIPHYIIGINRGGTIPAVLLSHYLNISMQTLQVSLRDHEFCESNCVMAEDAIGYIPENKRKQNGGHKRLECYVKRLLIVDDINDTGKTIKWIKNDWQQSCLPEHERWNNVWNQNVRFATLVDNISSNEVVDYNMWEIDKMEEDCWVVFPYEEWWKPSSPRIVHT